MLSSIHALLQQAIAHHQQGRLQAAEDLYVQVLQHDPRQFDALHLIGLIAKQRGDTQSALNFFAKALAVDARQAKLHCNMGATFQEIGEYAQALASYELALSLQNDYALAWNNRGNSLRYMQRYQEALDSFTRALEIQGNYPEAYFNRGICLQELQQHAQALLDLNDALQLRTDYPEAQFAYGYSCHQLGEYDNAVLAYTRALQLHQSPSASKLAAIYCNRGMTFAKLRHFAEALNDLQTAQTISPTMGNAYLQAGHVYRELQEYEAAIQAYQSALSLTPHLDQRQHIDFLLASLGAATMPNAAPTMYVKDLFDQYAGHFDAHLQTLAYQIPQLLEDALQSYGLTNLEQVLDLGCGTGLCGNYLASLSQQVVGVDLSEKMLAKARARQVYADLICDDIVHYLAQSTSTYELILAADVLVYLGQLDHLFALVKTRLATDGYFAFSVEEAHDADYQLLASQRYAHSARYIQQLAQQHSLAVRRCSRHIGRHDGKVEINSLIVVLQNGRDEA